MAVAADLGIPPRELATLSRSALGKLREETAVDDLTGVLRRGCGLATLERFMASARRRGTPLTVAFLDVDELKRVNDTHGHDAGDALIRGVAGCLKDRLREEDLVIRYGGDELVCALVGTEPLQAIQVLEDVRREAERKGWSFSAGATAYRPGDCLEELLARADQAMYEEKLARRRQRMKQPGLAQDAVEERSRPEETSAVAAAAEPEPAGEAGEAGSSGWRPKDR